MSKKEKIVTQRQLRVGEMIKQALGMIFLRDEAKLPNLQTRADARENAKNLFLLFYTPETWVKIGL